MRHLGHSSDPKNLQDLSDNPLFQLWLLCSTNLSYECTFTYAISLGTDEIEPTFLGCLVKRCNLALQIRSFENAKAVMEDEGKAIKGRNVKNSKRIDQ